MKITYPKCQVEITAEEFITVIDHFTTKVTCNTEPTFEPGGFVPDNEQPAPKPYPATGEKVIPSTSEDEVFLSSAMRRFFESEEKRQWMGDMLTEKSRQRIVDCENTLEEVINGGDTKSITGALAGLEDAWLNAETKPVETPEPALATVGSTKSRKDDSTKEKESTAEIPLARKNDSTKKKKKLGQAQESASPLRNRMEDLQQHQPGCQGHRHPTQPPQPRPPERKDLQRPPGALLFRNGRHHGRDQGAKPRTISTFKTNQITPNSQL